jgi:hypothetical protein
MFKKLKTNIKNKIKEWLGITELNVKLNAYKESNNLYAKYLKNEISNNSEAITSIHRTLENVIHIGTDVRPNQYDAHSWAVVCVEGKMNLVKFIDLRNQDGREILQFLKRYEAGRHCIDAPCSGVFYDGLFKF